MRAQPPLIALGLILLVLGLAIFGWLMLGRPDSHQRDQLPPRAAEPTDRATGDRSRVWPILAGLSLAAGGACVGIGMNRWRATPRV
ncbi:MAG TPA: hypothetical protein VFO19_14285 [Vicinamibacterales bacterium]|nr:hypothetical protein [Vicinamibacterales bacterium]